jgi:hypothetical protein
MEKKAEDPNTRVNKNGSTEIGLGNLGLYLLCARPLVPMIVVTGGNFK